MVAPNTSSHLGVVPDSGHDQGDTKTVPPRLCTRLAIVDDQQMVLSALHAWIGQADASIQVVITAPSWAELISHPAFPVDVVLLDLDLGDDMPASVKISTLRQAGVAVIMISNLADPARIKACLVAGAVGYLPKSEPAEEILRAVSAAGRGEAYMSASLATLLVEDQEAHAGSAPALSPQELRALTLYASGLPMKSVARRIGVTPHTAKSYIDRVREKYADLGRGARTKLELHLRAVEDGLLIEE
jgi:two-component system uhpT operon response regulator UhpA